MLLALYYLITSELSISRLYKKRGMNTIMLSVHWQAANKRIECFAKLFSCSHVITTQDYQDNNLLSVIILVFLF